MTRLILMSVTAGWDQTATTATMQPQPFPTFWDAFLALKVVVVVMVVKVVEAKAAVAKAEAHLYVSQMLTALMLALKQHWDAVA